MSKRSEKRLDSEMQFHIEAAAQDYVSKGFPRNEAAPCAHGVRKLGIGERGSA